MEANVKEIINILKTREEIDEYREKIDALRGKVTSRKNTATVLHTKNYASRSVIRAKTASARRTKFSNLERERSGVTNDFFVTQNPPELQEAAPLHAGGGFVIKRESPRVIEGDDNDCIIGIPSSTPRKTAASAIYKPKTARKISSASMRPK